MLLTVAAAGGGGHAVIRELVALLNLDVPLRVSDHLFEMNSNTLIHLV